jgi:hypothetical protein
MKVKMNITITIIKNLKFLMYMKNIINNIIHTIIID